MSAFLVQYILVPIGYMAWQLYAALMSALLSIVIALSVGGASVAALFLDAAFDSTHQQVQLATAKQEIIMELDEPVVQQPVLCVPVGSS